MATLDFCSTGRRKTATAIARLKPGDGKIFVNSKSLPDYFGGRETNKMVVQQPLALTGLASQYDVYVKVRGGGVSGQAGAIRHAIARALAKTDTEAATSELTLEGAVTSIRQMMRKAKYLTRDARKVERKKYGLKKARKATQFSKR